MVLGTWASRGCKMPKNPFCEHREPNFDLLRPLKDFCFRPTIFSSPGKWAIGNAWTRHSSDISSAEFCRQTGKVSAVRNWYFSRLKLPFSIVIWTLGSIIKDVSSTQETMNKNDGERSILWSNVRHFPICTQIVARENNISFLKLFFYR